MASLNAPLTDILGAKTAKAFEALEVTTVGDLLRHFPRRYATRGDLTPLKDLVVGEEATVVAKVAASDARPMRQRRGFICTATLTDGSGELKLTFFGKKNLDWRKRQLAPGTVGLFTGKVEDYRGQRQLSHPQYVLFDQDDVSDVDEAQEVGLAYSAALIPLYPSTKDLATWNISKTLDVALAMADLDDDPLPADVRAAHQLVDERTAYDWIHRPESWAQITKARTRLKWDEAFVVQVALAQRRAAARAVPTKRRPGRPGGLLDAFDAALPFVLTAGQQEVAAQLARDLADDRPMHRLLQGEVGSGKTVVALRAMLTVIDSGGQAALLAPTEVLAQQHARSIGTLLGPLAMAGQLGSADTATKVTLITGSLSAAARRAALLDAASGAAGIVVGTHALLEENVQFADLGLVVVDEQHRFGVEQRDALRAKGVEPPHVLVMTATPIPRTVAMTVYGDLEVSTLRELPVGRSPIQTNVVPAGEKPGWMDRVWARVREEVDAGHQVYVVCPRIGDDVEAGDELLIDDVGDRPMASVLDVHPMLTGGPLSGLRVEMLHGRMSSDDKDATMRRFAAGEIDVLVATTVIEVGVDVANATVMVILDAERFGISQLHQLRGRVGRGSAPGLCLLVTYAEGGTPARERLDAVAGTLDGFRLSEVDLETRREGDVLSVAQAGRRRTLRMLSVLQDADLIRAAREAATALVDADPDLDAHPATAAAVTAAIEPGKAAYLEKA
jgi:ATP-dependent DNA helicase RecG